MTRRTTQLALRASLVGLSAVLAGCRDTEEDRAARTARDALGIKETSEHTTGTDTRKVVVIEEKKVVDQATGQVLSDKKTETPVAIETRVKKSVDVDVGQTTGTAKAK